MNSNLKDILSHLNTDIKQETLLKYLQGKLSLEEQHEVEKTMLEDNFDADAMEGLQTFPDTQQISALVDQLNRDLKKKTGKKKWLFKREAKLESWLLLTVIILLLLIVVSFLVIYMMNK